ncbi:unnamed protein product, partial [Staurois parvus]
MWGDQMNNCVLFHWLAVCLCLCALHCNHTALDGCAVHSHPKQCARADRKENCIVYIRFSSPSET